MRMSIAAALGALVAFANASTLNPPVLPLVVRNPYLSTWLANARKEPWDHWPIFWTGHTQGFAVMTSIPESNAVFPLLGRPQDFLRPEQDGYRVIFPQYDGASFDASTTNLTYTISKPDGHGHTKLVLSFSSPITPTSTFRQSLPASYMAFYVEGDTDLSIFVDVNGEWVSGNKNNQIKWELQDSSKTITRQDEDSHAGIKSWKISRRYEQLLTEFDDQAEWGTLYFSGPPDIDYQNGEAVSLRRHFARTGSLSNTIDQTFRGMFDQEPLFAFSKTFRLSSSSGAAGTDSALFTFALIQDPIAQYAAPNGLTHMKPLWASYFSTAEDMLQYHYEDFQTVTALANNYSNQLAADAYASGSTDYQDIAALSARQVFGATQWTGTPENPILFLKEISSDGNMQTIDVIYPAFPFFLYTNPQWLAYLLEPLIEHQLSGQYPNDYSMHDLGSHFPNATGHADGRDEEMPVEECGNMLIMALALANALRDDPRPDFLHDVPSLQMERDVKTMAGATAAKVWVARALPLLEKWTGYLVREALIPADQLCTDDFAGKLANQTNLALKGIIGIKAMGELSGLVGNMKEAVAYKTLADEYIEKWQGFGISRDQTHAKLSYTWQGSWTTLYNLYADALLCFHIPHGESYLDEENSKSTFIPDKVYQMQSDWYHNVLQKYGLPLDQRSFQTKSDWEFFAAAVTSRKVRSELLQSVASWVNETSTDSPLTDLYDTEGTGGYPGIRFIARPVIGGHFAFLALERACKGKAVEALAFLDQSDPKSLDVQGVLRSERAETGEAAWEEL